MIDQMMPELGFMPFTIVYLCLPVLGLLHACCRALCDAAAACLPRLPALPRPGCPQDNDRLVSSYSGGWQMRMCLGKLLLQVGGG
jgi:hypothetical protein